MADIVFNPDERDYHPANRASGGRSALVSLMMALGAKTERSANQALFIIAILIFALAGYILFRSL